MAETPSINGYRVLGPTRITADLHSWYFPDEETANKFAQVMCQDTGEAYEVLKLVGTWRRAAPPVEYVPAVVEESQSQET